jgi:hypothetical protein
MTKVGDKGSGSTVVGLIAGKEVRARGMLDFVLEREYVGSYMASGDKGPGELTSCPSWSLSQNEDTTKDNWWRAAAKTM